MPQLKIPATLYHTALSRIRLLIVKMASAIYQTFGSYDNAHCRQAVFQFSQYLSSNIPTHIIDELYNSSEILLDSEIVERGHIFSFEKQIKFDQRIVLSMYLHNNMRELTAHRIVNDVFWKLTLPSLQNLLRLDLNKVCTDEILEVVGKHCINLEFVNIVSKSCYTRAKDRHNALKLQLCVSDTGLNFLSNCKQLKEIYMTCIIRKGCGGRQITNEGIKNLLLSLPRLSRINYTDTGMLLDSITSNINKLSLVSLTDYHPCGIRIPKIEFLCPYLNELHLTYAFSIDDYRSDVISALSSSGLKISILGLTNFPFDDVLKKYFELKGVYLKVFNFFSSVFKSTNELFRLLGFTCPNLECIQMSFHVFDRSVISNPNYSTFENNDKLFCNLKSVIIKGVYWDSKYVLPLLLKNAVLIKKVDINNHSYSGYLDNTLRYIQKTNHFHHLETVSFLKGANVTFEFLRTFLFSCPVLKNVTIESDSVEYSNLVEQLREECLFKNMDINIEIF